MGPPAYGRRYVSGLALRSALRRPCRLGLAFGHPYTSLGRTTFGAALGFSLRPFHFFSCYDMSIIPKETAEQLAQLIRAWNAKGFSPATSTNYSFRVGADRLAISKSGRDKSQFSAQDFMLVDLKGRALPPFEGERSSAETLLLTVLYEENEAINVVVHTHSIYGTLLSDYYLKQGDLRLSQYELLKALPQFDSHDADFELPIFPNTQDIEQLSEDFRRLYLAQPATIAYLIAGHGLYTWGKSIAEAKRHLEALEFLLEVHYKKLLLAPR